MGPEIGYGEGSNSLNSPPPLTLKDEAAQIKAALQASLPDGHDQIETFTDELDPGSPQNITLSVAGNVESDGKREELPQHVTSTGIQNEDNTNTEPNMPLEYRPVSVECGSKNNYVPWLGRWLTLDWEKFGRISRIFIVVSCFSTLLLFLFTQLVMLIDLKGSQRGLSIAVIHFIKVALGVLVGMTSIFLFWAFEKLLMASELGAEISWAAKLFAKQPTRVILIVGAAGISVGMTEFLSWRMLQTLLSMDVSYIWPALSMPRSYSKCDARVSPDQASLFTPKIYHNQFDHIVVWSLSNETGLWKASNKFETDFALYDSIRANQTLCAQGFQANTDLYGLGLRFGVYTQWISSILSNNFMPADMAVLQKVYLVFCLAVCVTTVVLSIVHACIFSVEIELLYWLYWGGFVCVFASSPNSIRLGQIPKWIGIDWMMVVLFAMHTVMIYHAMWFLWYAYDMVFSRMPCGTFHFFLIKLSDPSRSFYLTRMIFTFLIEPFIDIFVLVPPLVMILLLAEIKHFVQTSALFQLVFTTPKQSGHEALQTQVIDIDRSTWRLRDSSVYLRSRKLYFGIRQYFGFPDHGHGGIRLITPIDLEHRRCVAFAATMFEHKN